MKAWTGCTSDTSNIVKFTNATTNGAVTSVCWHHSIRRTYARGNQHQRREHGRCVFCGKRFTRLIKWATKDARAWWKAA